MDLATRRCVHVAGTMPTGAGHTERGAGSGRGLGGDEGHWMGGITVHHPSKADVRAKRGAASPGLGTGSNRRPLPGGQPLCEDTGWRSPRSPLHGVPAPRISIDNDPLGLKV